MEDIEQPVEQIEQETKVEPQDVRGMLTKALEETRSRDESGKFVKKAKEEPKEAVKEVTKDEIKEDPIKAPESLPKEIKEQWANLPRSFQQAWAKREEDVHKGFTRLDEERNFGKKIRELVSPYMPQIRAEGANEVQAIESLLNTAHLLRTGNMQQKAELLLRTAQQFGVDLMPYMTQAAQQQPNFNPQVLNHMVQSQVAEQVKSLQEQRERAELNSHIQAFSSDTEKFPHFETVKPLMASILNSGEIKATTPSEALKEAYDLAVKAHPSTSSIIRQQQEAEVEAKRLAEQKAKADAARKAGSSIKGSPAGSAPKNGEIPITDIRESLRAGFRAVREA